jgi:Domain of unknown function (DUF4437)
MARPLIDFIYAQNLPWVNGKLGPAREDVAAKILSFDPDLGEVSAVVHYPPGWSRDRPEALSCEEEFYVLDGEMIIGNRRYSRDTYACLPAGFTRETAASPTGCVVLTFYDGLAGSVSPGGDRRPGSALIEFIDLYSMPWDTNWADQSLKWMDPRRKVLRWDTERDQVATVVFAKPPHIHPEGWSSPMVSHPCAEETFVLAGEVTGERGRQRAGAYMWHPAGAPHGTLGSRDGGMSLARMRHGKLENIWDGSASAAFTFEAPYDPKVPEELASVAKEYVGQNRY